MTFEEFAAGQLSEILGFALVLTGDRASAEDIVQETLIRAYRHWDKITSLDRPEFYIRKMVVNEFLSSRRRLWRQVPSGRGSDLDNRLVPDHASRYAEQDALLSELRKLPRRQRAVVVLRYCEDLSDAGIAEILGCAPVTVRGYASRALATLRIELSAGERKNKHPFRRQDMQAKDDKLMHTEDDLRAALRTGKTQVPAAMRESVLRAVYDAAPRRRPALARRIPGPRLVAAAVTATAVAAAVTALAVLPVQPGAGSPGQLLSFTRHGGDIDVIILNPLAGPARYRAEFAQHHMDITLDLVPVAPSLVGTLVVGYAGFGITAITSGNCDSRAGACPEIGLRIPVGFHGPATIEFGLARPGERYAQAGPATAPGEPLHGLRYVCQNVSAVLAMLSQRHVSAVVRYPTATGGRLVFGADVPPGPWYVNEATLLAPGQVMLWVGSPCTPGLPGSAPGLPGAVTPQPAPSAAPIPSPAA